MSEKIDEPNLPTPKNGVWWIVSLCSLVGCIGVGIFIGLAQPHRESDWLGLGRVIPFFCGIGLGALLCVIFATISVVKGESGRLWALLAALPCGALLLWVPINLAEADIQKTRQSEAALRQEQCQAQLRKNPELGLLEKWYESKNKDKFCAYQNSFNDSQVPYSVELLERIYREVPKSENYVFKYPGCSSEFLAAHFQEACNRACDRDWLMLQHIVSNPNTPLRLVETVANSKQLDFRAVRAAQAALNKRSGIGQPSATHQ